MKPAIKWRWTRRLGFGLAAATLAGAAVRSARLAAAEKLFFSGRPEAVRRAVRLEPRRALYRLGAAEARALEGKDPREQLRAAVKANPYDASVRIRLGMEAEARGDLGEAEAELLEAARRSRKYLPRWTLAGYYFRHGGGQRFWVWAREALSIAPGSPDALFDLCWKREPAAETVLARAIPERPEIKIAFAEFLGRRGHWAQAARLAPELLHRPTRRQTPRLLALLDGFVSHQQIPAGVEIWNGLCRRGWLPWAGKGARSSQWLTNPRFARFPSGHGFDWRLHELPGASFHPAPGGGLRIELSGRQPERTWLLRQWVPVFASGPLRLKCRYEVSTGRDAAGNRPTGVRWRIWAAAPREGLLGECRLLRAAPAGGAAAGFVVPSGVRLLRVELVHERQPGNSRFRGHVTLSRVTLELQEGLEKP